MPCEKGGRNSPGVSKQSMKIASVKQSWVADTEYCGVRQEALLRVLLQATASACFKQWQRHQTSTFKTKSRRMVSLVERVIFNDKSTFNIWMARWTETVLVLAAQKPPSGHEASAELTKSECPLCHLREKVYGAFFFQQVFITGMPYLSLLNDWLMGQPQQDSQTFICHQDIFY